MSQEALQKVLITALRMLNLAEVFHTGTHLRTLTGFRSYDEMGHLQIVQS